MLFTMKIHRKEVGCMSGSNMMRSFVVAWAILTLGAGLAHSNPDSEAIVPPDEAMHRLMEGNRHYVDNKLTHAATSNAASRTALAGTQHPYAVILSCSDSRVPPEIIFDKGLGELFVVRVAGNIPDPVVLGSIEYAAEHLGSTLIMVLGHERCGAVIATVEAKGKSSGSSNIDAIVSAIEPSVDLAVTECAACKGEKDCAATKKSELVNCVIATNAHQVAAHLTANSKILEHLAEENKIRIVVANYDLDDGKVTVVK
jgi:carbonic anhydrase